MTPKADNFDVVVVVALLAIGVSQIGRPPPPLHD